MSEDHQTIEEAAGAPKGSWHEHVGKASSLASSACSSPICGNCGKPYNDHYFEDRVYCYQHTTGDIYTEEPNDDCVVALIPPSVWKSYVDQWKRENGHSKTNSREQERL